MATARTPRSEAGQSAGPAISAHRADVRTGRDGTLAAYRSALDAGAEYLEFDVRATADGQLIAWHPARLRSGRPVAATGYAALCRAAGHHVPTVSVLLRQLAGRAAAHIDVKDVAAAPAIVAAALEVLAPENVVVTTREPAAVAMIRRRYPAVGAGLTIGGDTAKAARHAIRSRRSGSARPGRPAGWADEVEAAHANWAVVHRRLARSGVLAECRGRGLATMVWTVNGAGCLRSWLASPDVDVIVTDEPGLAVSLRKRPPS